MKFDSYIVSETKTAFSFPITTKFPCEHKKFSLKRFKEKAFTLAETLITLSIIGVVSAMTVPTLMVHYKEKATVARVKKAHSILSNAAKMAKADGTLEVVQEGRYCLNGSAVLEKIKPGINCIQGSDNCFKPDNVGYGSYINPNEWYIVAEDGMIYGYHCETFVMNGDTYMGFGATPSGKEKTFGESGNAYNWGKMEQYGFFINTNTGDVIPAGSPSINDLPDNWHKLKKSDTCPDTYGGCTYWTLKTGKVKKKNGEWFDTIKK